MGVWNAPEIEEFLPSRDGGGKMSSGVQRGGETCGCKFVQGKFILCKMERFFKENVCKFNKK